MVHFRRRGPDAARPGGLMSYAPKISDLVGRAAGQVDKTPKGVKTADLHPWNSRQSSSWSATSKPPRPWA
jgi:hypothetical protein